ncbi:trypsin-like serine peptidase [Clavibacter sp. CFBP 8614]|uniref:trypsin-like serine peptidase n=1 Tax=unclassified Clavibacter TaxID=2626594 RepID=UPI004041E2C6
MAEATPVEMPKVDDATMADAQRYFKQYADEEVHAEDVKPAPAKAVGDAARDVTPVSNFSPTNGKIYFRDASTGENKICSGSALNSPSRRLVATAGHCVHKGPGGSWHQNWAFVPEYHNGARPHGTFTSNYFRTMDDWIGFGATGRGFASDFAMVTTNTNASGSTVVNAVGGHGMTWTGNVFDATLFGYPANVSSGEVMQACWGGSENRYLDFYRFHGMSGCNWGGGASGGPWLRDYSNSSGLGVIMSVSSWGPADGYANINGPHSGAL